MGLVRWRGWGLVLAVLAALGGLAVAGRLLDLPQDRLAATRPSLDRAQPGGQRHDPADAHPETGVAAAAAAQPPS